MTKLLDYNNGIATTFHEEDNKVHVKTSEDVSGILKLNAIDRNHSQQHGSFRKAATIPRTVWMQWRNKLKAMGRNPDPFAQENRPWLIATLNNKEWLKLRTNEDKL